MKLVSLIISLCTISYVRSLDNGLARTPPMGWIAWERFRCITDCKTFPEKCISEDLFLKMAELVVSEGFLEVGYEYVNIDDCYLSKQRNAQGKLVADPKRFPSGLPHLADQIHSLGLKFGVYEDYGNLTCAGYPGTFKEWKADMLKLDGCNVNVRMMDIGYPEMGAYLNKTGRPMLYSCSWPDYERGAGMKPNFTAIAEHCNIWRLYDDIQDSWDSVLGIINYFGDHQDILIAAAGPGHWNDPDMIIVGNYGLSYDQSKAQMAIWSILAAPLLMSNDLRQLKPEFKEILQNRYIIAVDQDPLGIQGRRIYKKNNIQIWRRPITPTKKGKFSFALAVLNTGTGGISQRISLNFGILGLTSTCGYHVQDLYTNQDHGVVKPSDSIYVDVNPTGVVMLKAEVGNC
ncbi:Alpha-N-acetylgalactosaminidase [Nymphon striatum]|nr:Alpha-N-acetylgalactosaminidase [Nymphon striatum]